MVRGPWPRASGVACPDQYDTNMLSLIQGGGECFMQVVRYGKVILSLIQMFIESLLGARPLAVK